MKIIDDIVVFGEAEQGVMEQAKRCRDSGACHVALMADNHKGYGVPIGGVVAYQDMVSPSGVGFDIGCGNNALAFKWQPTAPGRRERINGRTISDIMDDVSTQIEFGIGKSNADEELMSHPIFDDPRWSNKIIGPLKEMARQQLGTVGGGNHFVDIFQETNSYKGTRIWVGCHFGSRGFGWRTAKHFFDFVQAKDDMDSEPTVFPLDSTDALGWDYLELMDLAGEYAKVGRRWVCRKVQQIMGFTDNDVTDSVENHHNFAWQEEHEGLGKVWVVRKGATPLLQPSFIGSTMCGPSVIIEPKQNKTEAHKLSLESTVHGAGRVMGRREATGKWKKGRQVREGKVTPDMMRLAVAQSGIELRGGDLDESPHCYKDMSEVLHEHSTVQTVEHVLYPLGVAMAPARTFDPYKD